MTSADCATGQICNTTTNTCENEQAETCDRPGTCGGGLICDVSTGECGTSATCSTSASQPDVCPYGQFCSTGNCAEVPAATSACSNFAGTHTLTWGAGDTGPVPASAVRVETRRVDVSSTEIRDRVRTGRTIRGFVPEAVGAYIAAERLYR